MLGTLTFPSPSSVAFRPRRMLARAAISEASPPSAAVAAAGSPSFYEVLRVRRNASQTEIKTAYRTLAKLYHPDAASRFMDSSVETDGRDFIEIRNAYSTLSDPDARAVYDFSLRAGSRRRLGAAGVRGTYYPTRRWETDQCW